MDDRGGPDQRFPDFYIVGAPRSGTTFMYEYLKEHPAIFMSQNKEPGYMCSDLDSGSYLDSLSFTRSTEEYLSLFADARPDQLTGEASTWYLYSRVAARRIRESNPRARAIIMLRDPAEMLHSLHERRLYGGSEDLERFEDALAAQDERREGFRIPSRARNVKAFQYFDVGRYAEQVERYFELFGRPDVCVVIFEDFRADPGRAYGDVVRFLGLEPEVINAEVVNASAQRRSVRARRLLLTPGFVRFVRAVIPQRLRPPIGRIVDRLSTRPSHRPQMLEETRSGLHRVLGPDVARLSDLLGRDLIELWGYRARSRH